MKLYQKIVGVVFIALACVVMYQSYQADIHRQYREGVNKIIQGALYGGEPIILSDGYKYYRAKVHMEYQYNFETRDVTAVLLVPDGMLKVKDRLQLLKVKYDK